MTDQAHPAGPQRRFNNLFHSHAPAVFRLAIKAFGGDRDRASDIVQEVFLAVWEQYDRDFLNAEAPEAAALIMTIAKRRVIDSWRRSDGVVSVPDYTDTVVPMLGLSVVSKNPADRVLDDDTVKYVWQVLRQNLTATEYRVAVMAWDLWLPDAEIAKIIGASVSTVHSHKSRARRRIRAIETSGSYRIEFDPHGRFPHTPRRGADNGGEVTA
ncbi:RNA polymerase sigma factor [Nocardia asiatica]|uniref:RNA polymerase sigma factor n=1 Tax=Nocardia asiatica TaxID=209252 RepID=UPI002456B490|nr:sigma-70 family RNA polymerase sigma factor [Nocardia asiatica]